VSGQCLAGGHSRLPAGHRLAGGGDAARSAWLAKLIGTRFTNDNFASPGDTSWVSAEGEPSVDRLVLLTEPAGSS